MTVWFLEGKKKSWVSVDNTKPGFAVTADATDVFRFALWPCKLNRWFAESPSVCKDEDQICVYGVDWWAGERAGAQCELGEGIELIALRGLGKSRKSAALGNQRELLQQGLELLCAVNWRELGGMRWGKSGGEVEGESMEQMHLFSIGKDGVGGEWSCLKLAWWFLCFVASFVILERDRSWRRN